MLQFYEHIHSEIERSVGPKLPGSSIFPWGAVLGSRCIFSHGMSDRVCAFKAPNQHQDQEEGGIHLWSAGINMFI